MKWDDGDRGSPIVMFNYSVLLVSGCIVCTLVACRCSMWWLVRSIRFTDLHVADLILIISASPSNHYPQ